MKKIALIFLLSGIASAQLVRFDTQVTSISTSSSTPYLIANIPPNSPTLQVCSYPANTVPCTNYATTYTASNVACPNGSQDTPQPAGTSSCQTSGDAQGNIGFWVPTGTYDYTFCLGISCYGPFTVTVGGSGVSTLVVKTAGTTNASQTLLNFNASSTNAAGISLTPSNPSGGIELYEAAVSNKQTAINAIAPTPTRAGDILYNNGTNWTNLAGNNSGTSYLQEDSSGNPSWASSGSITGSGTSGTIPIWTSATGLGNSNLTYSASVFNFANAVHINSGGSALSVTGGFGTYNGLSSLGNGMAQVVGLRQGSAFTGNMSPASMGITVPASGHQFFRINCYLVITTAASSSSTLPACQVSWTDANTSVVETSTFSSTSTANTVGTYVQGSMFINPLPGTVINVSTTGYLSSGGTAMTYINGFDLESL